MIHVYRINIKNIEKMLYSQILLVSNIFQPNLSPLIATYINK